jgi:hypothetical protein
MLYDPKWETQTEAKPTLQGFVAWLERQKAEARYQYMPCSTCAIGQYLTSIGTSYSEQCDGTRDYQYLCEWNHMITAPGVQTFGAALERARKYAASLGN